MSDTLTQAKGLLVRRWGEMGGYWGINRTMAEIHALLFVSGQPLCTDDIMEQLHISRGNASMNLRGLVDWGLIHRVHHLGDRKEYFQADTDVWHMFETIMRERRRREVEPIVATIDRCREMVANNGPAAHADTADAVEAAEFQRRLGELHSFLTAMSTLFELVLQFRHDDIGQLVALFRQYPAEAPAATPAAAAPAHLTSRRSAPADTAAAGANARPRSRRTRR